jgi:hypothetical protein
MIWQSDASDSEGEEDKAAQMLRLALRSYWFHLPSEVSDLSMRAICGTGCESALQPIATFARNFSSYKIVTEGLKQLSHPP